MNAIAQIPIRIRITLAFTIAMAVLLAGLGVFVIAEEHSHLDESIDKSLRIRAGETASQIGSGGPALATGSALIEPDETFAQLLAADGTVIDASGELGDTPLLDEAQLATALAGAVMAEADTVPGIEGSSRLLAVPATTAGEQVVVIAGASLGDNDEALARLRTLLILGGLAALAIASLCGYLAAAAALGPVDEMRRRAAELSARELSGRLPVPPATDEISRLAITLNDLLGRLSEAIERERRFVDDASHELRTPLTLHRAELELGLRHGRDPAELRASIAAAIHEADRLIRLTESLLVVARSEHGNPDLSIEPVPVDDLVATVANRMRPRAGEQGRSLKIGDSCGTTILADRLWLDQALTNLVGNALDHGSGEVRVVASRTAETVLIEVEDDGPGFDEEFLPHAFERFSRADSGRTGGGAGLGLAIVETIARAHGGQAGAANRPGTGASVWIELPLGDGEDTA